MLTEWYFDWSCREHPKQQAWIQAHGYMEKYLVTGSRFGKSEGAAMDLLVFQAANPGCRICNTSITQDQAEIVWNIAVNFAVNSPRFRHWVADLVYSPFPKLTLTHGGEFWARSTQYRCKHIRGHKFDKINYDELSYGDEDDDQVLKMRLADTGGQYSGTTTPRGKNQFYRNCWRPAQDEMRNAKAEGRRSRSFCLSGTSFDNPHIDHEYLRNVNLTARQREQEIGGVFLDNDEAPFTEENIKGVTDADRNDALQKTQDQYRSGTVDAPGRYIVAYDIAKKADWTVGGALRVDVAPWKLVWFTRYQRQPWPVVEADMEKSARIFQGTFGYDATGIGDPVGDHLKISLGRLVPIIYTADLKTKLIQNLVYCMETGKFVMPFIKELQDELYSYEWEDRRLVQDCVMMLAMMMWLANDEKPAAEVW